MEGHPEQVGHIFRTLLEAQRLCSSPRFIVIFFIIVPDLNDFLCSKNDCQMELSRRQNHLVSQKAYS